MSHTSVLRWKNVWLDQSCAHKKGGLMAAFLFRESDRLSIDGAQVCCELLQAAGSVLLFSGNTPVEVSITVRNCTK